MCHVTQTAVFVDPQGRSCADWLVQTRLDATLRPSRSQPLEEAHHQVIQLINLQNESGINELSEPVDLLQ